MDDPKYISFADEGMISENTELLLEEGGTNHCYKAEVLLHMDAERINGQNSVKNFFKDFLRHVWRALNTNLSVNTISDDEKNYLSTEHNITASIVQNYLGYRRSCMYTMIVPLVLDCILGIYNQSEDQKVWNALKTSQSLVFESLKNVFSLMSVLHWLSIILYFVSIVLAIVALKNWYNFRKSRKFVAWAWSIYFFASFVMSFFPYRIFVTFPDDNVPHYGIFAQMNKRQYQGFVGLYLGAYFFLKEAPAALTLSIALIRASLNVRTLVPQSPLPGYLCALIPFIYAPTIWIAFVILNQAVGNALMFLSVLVFVLSPFMFIAFNQYTTKPMPSKLAYKYSWRLRFAYISLVVLSVLLFVTFLRTFNFGDLLLNQLFTPWKVFALTVSFLCEYFFTNVFIADCFVLVLGTIRSHELQLIAKSGGNSALLQERDRRLNELVQLA